MELIPILGIVYLAIVGYDVARGMGYGQAITWPLQTLSKMFAFGAKVDPNVPTKDELAALSSKVDAAQISTAAKIDALIATIKILHGGGPTPPAPPAVTT